jgi:hypothetical protein
MGESEGEEFIYSFSFSFSMYFWCNLISFNGHGVAYWLKHCATIRKVLGSIAGGVTGDFFRCMRQSICPGSTRLLKMSTMRLLGVKTAGEYGQYSYETEVLNGDTQACGMLVNI